MPREPRILVVEDDSRIRRELLDALRSAGYEVDVAVSYRDGVISSERDYSLVLLDLGLPDGDGLDLVRHLRGCGRGIDGDHDDEQHGDQRGGCALRGVPGAHRRAARCRK